MSFFVGYFPSLTRSNSNLMWHNVFVTAPLFGHIDFNAWFRSFGGSLVFFGWFSDVVWTPIFYLRPPSFWYHTASFIGFDPHQPHQYKVIHRKYCHKLEYQLTLPNSHYWHCTTRASSSIGVGGRGWRQHVHISQPHIILNRCGRTWLTTARAHLPTAHSSQNVSSASTYNLSDVHS
jgi:hypothetical protein